MQVMLARFISQVRKFADLNTHNVLWLSPRAASNIGPVAGRDGVFSNYGIENKTQFIHLGILESSPWWIFQCLDLICDFLPR